MQGIVIQGPTNYYKEVADCWSGWPNVVWSTWESEPKENIEYIKSKNIDVLLNKPPIFAGDMNINYQALSTFNGLMFLKERGVKAALKTRGDHTISDVKTFLELLYPRKIAFLAISNAHLRQGFYYYLAYDHHAHDYPADNLIYGEIDDMLAMFNLQTDKLYSVPPEALLCYNYMTNKKIPFDLSYEHFIKNNMTFFNGDCIAKGIKIHWLKRNIELTEFYNNQYFKF